MKLCDLLRHERGVKGWSLSEASERLGIAKGHLHCMESGVANNPRRSTLQAFRRVYKLSPTILLSSE